MESLQEVQAAGAERKAEAQPQESGVAEANDVLLTVTVIMPGAAAVASSDWFGSFDIYTTHS